MASARAACGPAEGAVVSEAVSGDVVGRRRILEKTLNDIRQGLISAVRDNAGASKDEQLDRDEFVIDEELRASLVRSGTERVDELKKSLADENFKRELLARRVREECLESHSGAGKELAPFDSGARVRNFPVPKQTEEEQRRARHVSFLRRVEIAEVKCRDGAATPMGRMCIEGGAAHSVGSARCGPAPRGAPGAWDLAAAVGDAGTDPAGGSREPDTPAAPTDDDAEEGPASLLYHAMSLYTPARRAAQCELLAARSAEGKAAFNARCEAVLEEKRHAIVSIEERAERAREVAAQLGVDPEVDVPGLDKGEDLEQILKVKDSEINVKKVLTQAELDAKASADRLEAERLAKQAADDAPRRALDDMMGGQLERTKEDTLECQREDWMDLPRDKLTKKQLKELNAYEEAVRVAAEADEKERKALEIELRGLRAEMSDIREAFDTSLRALAAERLGVEHDLCVDELMSVRLAGSVAELYGSQDLYEKLSVEADGLRMQREVREERLSVMRGHVDRCKEDLDTAAAADKAMDRGFKREFAGAEDHIDILSEMYKRRHGDGGPKSPRQGSPSPLLLAQTNEATGGTDAEGGASQIRPDGLDHAIWGRFLEYKATKLSSEVELRKAADALAAAQQKLAVALEEDKAARGQEEGVSTLLEDLEERVASLLRDLDMWFELKQGQVEVDQSAVGTDSTDARVLNVGVVQAFNTEITGMGGEKVAILEQLKQAKSEMHRNEWLNERADLMLRNMELKIKELQLLRVTRSLQTNLKKGEDNPAEKAAEVARLSARFAELGKVHATRVATRETKLQRIMWLVRQKRKENNALGAESASAEVVLEERQRMKEKRAQSAPSGTGRRSIRNVMANSKLMSIARSQQDEQAFLQSELERLRRRSFPAFPQGGAGGTAGIAHGSGMGPRHFRTAPVPPAYARRSGTADKFASRKPRQQPVTANDPSHQGDLNHRRLVTGTR